jgi:hypothetical protein
MCNEGPSLTPDQAAAHEFLAELRTRITTQPLPYQYGVEARALKSLWEVFAQARTAMKNNPGCAKFARRTTEILNIDLRPVTAKWDRAYTEGRLNSRDGANEFREDLAAVQAKLRVFASELHLMAYGSAGTDALTPEPLTPAELAECGQSSDLASRSTARQIGHVPGKFAHIGQGFHENLFASSRIRLIFERKP